MIIFAASHLNDGIEAGLNDTRLKVIAGALFLEDALIKPETAARLSFLVSRYVTRPQERTLFENFFSERSNDSSSAVSVSFAAAADPSAVPPVDRVTDTVPPASENFAPSASPPPPKPDAP